MYSGWSVAHAHLPNTGRARVLDLAALTPSERDYLQKRYAAFLDNPSYQEFWLTTSGPGNPLLQAAGGRITSAVWDHPLYQAVRDLEERLGIGQDEVAPSPGDDTESDPFVDEWLTVNEAARRKAVAATAIHKAIRRGDLIARPLHPGGRWLVVSANSLARWQPGTVRQAAARLARRHLSRGLPAPAA